MAKTRWNLNQRERNTSNPDNFSDIIDIQEETQAWIENLRQSTIDSSLSYAWTKSDLMIQQRWLEYERDLHSLVWFLSALDKLLEEIKDTKKWLSKKWLSKAWKKWIEESKFKLKQYEKQLKGKKKALLKQDRAEIYDNDIDHLRNSWQQVELIRREIWMAQWGEYADFSGYLYNSPEIAWKSNEHQADNLEFEQKLQTEVKEWAILHIFNWVEHKANEFYRRIAEWRYTRADYELFITNSAVLTPSFQRCGIAIPTNPRLNRWRIVVWNWWNERVTGMTRRSADYSNMDWWETFQQWWVAGIFDRLLSNCNNLTPWQRETWKSLWVLACVAWSIYWLYKFYTNKKMWFWAKAWITVWTIFGTEALLWETPLSLFNKIMWWWLSLDEMKDRFGNAISGIGSSDSEVAETTVPAMQSMMIFNSWATAGEVWQMTRTFKADNRNRKAFYNQSCSKIKNEYWEPAMETFQATFSDDFDEEKRKNWLASFWITWSTDDKETVYELANNAHMNKVAFEKFLADNKLEPTKDSAKKAELDEYIKSKNEKNETIKLDDLKVHLNDWFTAIPQTTDEDETPNQNTHNIEIKNDTLKPVIESWLSKLLKHFWTIYWSKINIINLKEEYIPRYATWITNDILLKIIKTNWNSISIDMSDDNIKYVYDNAVEKVAQSQTSILNSFNGLSKRIRKHKWDNIKSWKQTNVREYNKRKGNITESSKVLLEEISSYIKSQWWNLKIYRNWQEFSNIESALNSIPIFS